MDQVPVARNFSFSLPPYPEANAGVIADCILHFVMSDTAITPSSNGKKIKKNEKHPKPQRFKAFSYVLSNALPVYFAVLLPALHIEPTRVPVLTPGQKSITSDVVQ